MLRAFDRDRRLGGAHIWEASDIKAMHFDQMYLLLLFLRNEFSLLPASVLAERLEFMKRFEEGAVVHGLVAHEEVEVFSVDLLGRVKDEALLESDGASAKPDALDDLGDKRIFDDGEGFVFG